MKRFTIIPVLALALAACQEPTRPAAVDPEATTLSIPTTVGTFTLTVHSDPAGVPPGLSLSGSGETECAGFLAPATYENVVVPPGAICFMFGSTVLGNVRALEGSDLIARSNTVHGSFELLGTDFVSFQGGNVIGGNISAEKSKFLVDVVDLGTFGFGPNIIKGNIVLKEGVNVGICGNHLTDGQIHVQKNTGESLLAGGVRCLEGFGGGNMIDDRNIIFEDNVVVFSLPSRFCGVCGNGLQIGDNQIAQDLQVFKNKGTGEKTVAMNTVRQNLQCFENDLPFIGGPNVAGKAEGQCQGAPLPPNGGPESKR